MAVMRAGGRVRSSGQDNLKGNDVIHLPGCWLLSVSKGSFVPRAWQCQMCLAVGISARALLCWVLLGPDAHGAVGTRPTHHHSVAPAGCCFKCAARRNGNKEMMPTEALARWAAPRGRVPLCLLMQCCALLLLQAPQSAQSHWGEENPARALLCSVPAVASPSLENEILKCFWE